MPDGLLPEAWRALLCPDVKMRDDNSVYNQWFCNNYLVTLRPLNRYIKVCQKTTIITAMRLELLIPIITTTIL